MPTTQAQIDRLRDAGSDWPIGQNHNGSHPASYYDDLAEILDFSLAGNTANFSAEDLRVALQSAFDAVANGSLEP